MGGKGSGRPPSPETIVRRSYEQQTPIAQAPEPLTLPNFSGIDKFAKDTGKLSHTSLSDIGTNTHAQIDTHIADSTIHFTEASIDHNNITNTHNLTTDIDHNTITNNHNLTTDIDHDALTNYAANEHFTEASIDHANIQSIGTNTHAQIDTHIADTTTKHLWTRSGTTLKTATDGDDVQIGYTSGASPKLTMYGGPSGDEDENYFEVANNGNFEARFRNGLHYIAGNHGVASVQYYVKDVSNRPQRVRFKVWGSGTGSESVILEYEGGYGEITTDAGGLHFQSYETGIKFTPVYRGDVYMWIGATNGRVGIGQNNTSPSKALSVKGDITLEDGSGDYYSNDGSQGWTGTFPDGEGNTVTVKNGIITDVS